jgi:hypothetical protein
LPGKLLGAAIESKPVDRLLGGAPRIGHAIDASNEFKVLADGEVFIEAETLGHIADLAFDLV